MAVVAVMSSCTPDSGAVEPEPPLGEIKVVTTTAQLVLPLDSYRYSKQDQVTVVRAARLLTRECVHRFGGEYTLPDSAPSGSPSLDLVNGRRYGLFDLDSAAQRGYRVPDSAIGNDGHSPGETKGKGAGWDPSPEELFLVRGATGQFEGRSLPVDVNGQRLPPGGCSAEADSKIGEGAPSPVDGDSADLVQRLRDEAYQRAENDSRVRAAVAQWSSCMKRSGYDYQSIWQPNDQPWPDPVSDKEIATAVVDVKCKNETNLVGIWFAVEAAYQKLAVERHAEQLKELSEYLRVTARNAARLLNQQ